MNQRHDMERTIVDRYQRMADASRRMLSAARMDDWDAVCAAEKECATLIAELSKLGDLSPSDPALRQQKLGLMKRVLADDAEIRQLTQPWMRKLEDMMRTTGNAVQLGRAYGAGGARD